MLFPAEAGIAVAQLLSAVVETKTACEKAVAVGNVNEIVLCSANGYQRSCCALSPHINIMCCVANDRLLACCA